MAEDAAAPTRELSGTTVRQGAGPPNTSSDDLRDDPPPLVADNTGAVGSTTGTHVQDDVDICEGPEETTSDRTSKSHLTLLTLVGLVAAVAVAGLLGWLVFRSYESRQAAERADLFTQVGRQAAINLTTIDFAQADTDVARILDSATGTFHDDFSKRSQPFVDVVKQARSKSVGTITAAGLESIIDSEGQVLVAVTVRTSNAGAPEPQPRGWRMRISVQKVGDGAKVSNVEFVP